MRGSSSGDVKGRCSGFAPSGLVHFLAVGLTTLAQRDVVERLLWSRVFELICRTDSLGLLGTSPR
jgi:hypothetical protein